MHLKRPAGLLALAAAATAALLLHGTPSDAEEPGETAIVIELFTSQGCSSCPPADRLLSRLGREGLPGGVRVIPLSFHVDYWNYIGWTDPFSSAHWSRRQGAYAKALKLDTLYTPQIVIQGGAQVVGASPEEVLREIAKASHTVPPVDISLDLETLASERRLIARLSTRLEGPVPDRSLALMVALFEKDLSTPVRSGENASRQLDNDYVVRELRQVRELDTRALDPHDGAVTFEIDPGWDFANLGIAAFAQDPVTLKIYGAAVAES